MKNIGIKVVLILACFVLVYAQHLVLLIALKGVNCEVYDFFAVHDWLFSLLDLYLPLILSVIYVLISKKKATSKILTVFAMILLLMFTLGVANNLLTTICEKNDSGMCKNVCRESCNGCWLGDTDG